MFDVNDFINILKDTFRDTNFSYKYEKYLDLHQILHDNHDFEIDDNLENKIMELLGKYYYSKGIMNIMVSYDFYREINIKKEKIDEYSFSVNMNDIDFEVYKSDMKSYKKNKNIEAISYKQKYHQKGTLDQIFYEIGKAS